MDWGCADRCCGHTFACSCPNKPGPWDTCQPQKAYSCPDCGRAYWIHHGDTVSADGQPCVGADCDGTLVRRTGRRFIPYYPSI